MRRCISSLTPSCSHEQGGSGFSPSLLRRSPRIAVGASPRHHQHQPSSGSGVGLMLPSPPRGKAAAEGPMTEQDMNEWLEPGGYGGELSLMQYGSMAGPFSPSGSATGHQQTPPPRRQHSGGEADGKAE